MRKTNAITKTPAWALFARAAVSTLAAAVGCAQAATWQGGTNGNWTSAGVNNWGLGTGAYPGDGIHDAEPHTAANATIHILTGNSIATLRAITLSGVTLNMSGGTVFPQSRLQFDNGSKFNFTGGTLTGDTDIRLYDGTSLTLDGGELGTRITGIDGLAPPEDMLVRFHGTATLRVTAAGILDVHTLGWDYAGAGDTGTAIFEGVIPGPDTDRLALYVKASDADAAAATLRFVFSEEGLSGLRQFSNNGLTLGAPSRLEVDVSAFRDKTGTTPHRLIDYTGAIQGTGRFSTTNITDDVHGVLIPGTKGSLKPGEYHLDYADTALEANGTMITLYFRNPPRPERTVIMIR